MDKDKECIREFLKDKDLNKELEWCQEELAELIVAISHHKRRRDYKNNLSEEIGDVRIVIKFLEIIFEDKLPLIDRFYRSKMNRIVNKAIHNENIKKEN